MLERLISWSLSHRWIILLIAGLWIAVGLLAGRSLNIDAFPDTTPVQIQVNAYASSLVPEEIERQITFPLEMAMSGMPGLVEIRSISLFGLSQVLVTFQDGTDVYFARQMINERLNSVTMPEGVERPQMGPVSTGLGEVFHYFVIGAEDELAKTRTIHDWEIKPALRTVPGTAEVNSWGGLEKQYQVLVDPNKLLSYGLAFQQIVEAVKANNVNVGGGNIDIGGDMLLVHGLGRTVNAEQIADIVIVAKDGAPVFVKDVAEVVIGHEIRKGAVTVTRRDPHSTDHLLQGEAVLGLGFMLMGQNSYDVTHRMRERFETLQADLPPGVEMEVAYDRTDLVDRVIETVRNNLLEGATLVVLILFVFLGNLRAGLICAVAIPMSMLCGFCGMYSVGIAGSLLSLGAIDFGVVVDSSVVVVENIVKRLAHAGKLSGLDRLRCIRDAAIEVRTPTVFGQLIIMIVYLPILTLEGVEGKMFRPMAWTVMFILLGSLVCSLTITPVLASFVLPKHIREEDVFLVRLAKRTYLPLLKMAMQFKGFVALAAIAAVVAAGISALQLGTEFVPRLSEGAIVVGIIRPPGTNLAESLRINKKMEAILLTEFPDEVHMAWSRVGSPEVPTDASTVEATDLFVALQPRSQWTKARTQAELVSLMEKELIGIPGQTIWFTQPIEQRINEMISGVRADVAIKLFGKDFEGLMKHAKALERVLRDVPGCADLSTEQMLGQPILQVAIDQDQIARYGIPARQVLDLVEAVGGKVLGDVVEGQLRFPIAVRLPEHLRQGPAALASIVLEAPNGERVPLSRLATVRVVDGPRLISREWSERRIILQCNVRGRDVGSFVHDAQQRIAEQVTLPEAYRLEWGGQFQNMQRAQKRLAIVVPCALALIVGLLYLSFRNSFDTVCAFASVPFACVGGIAALHAREMPLSISAAVGFITLAGVSVLSSMVLISAIRDQQKLGASSWEAIITAGIESLRTIFMTALVASVGFVPMAVSEGAGAEVQRPLATVVIGGVITSMFFGLLVLPTLYAWLIRGPREIPTTGPIATSQH